MRDGGAQHLEPGARLRALGRKVSAERTCAGPAVEEPENVARHSVEAGALCNARSDIRLEGFEGRELILDRRLLAENLRIDAEEQPRVLIGRAAQHRAIDMG